MVILRGASLIFLALTLALPTATRAAVRQRCGGGPCLVPEMVASMLRPGSTTAFAAHANFGILWSEDGAKSWHLICEEVYGTIQARRNLVDPSGRIYVGSYDGFFSSGDSGCTWTKGGGLTDLAVDDLALTPAAPGKLWALGTHRVTEETGVYLSIDAGATFSRVGALPQTVTFFQVIVSASDARTVYAMGQVKQTTRSVLYHSTDGGATWASALYDSGTFPYGASLLGVAPDQPATVFLTRLGTTGVPDELWRSTDHGRTPARIIAMSGTSWITGFTFGATPETLYLGSRDPGAATMGGTLYVSKDGGITFGPPVVQGPGYRCLDYRDGKLYACAGDEVDGDAFAFGASTDEGKTWTPVLRYADYKGEISCAAGTCNSTVEWLCSLYGHCGFDPPESTTDAGPRDAPGDEADDRVGAEPREPADGCSCAAAGRSPAFALQLLSSLVLLAIRGRCTHRQKRR